MSPKILRQQGTSPRTPPAPFVLKRPGEWGLVRAGVWDPRAADGGPTGTLDRHALPSTSRHPLAPVLSSLQPHFIALRLLGVKGPGCPLSL